MKAELSRLIPGKRAANLELLMNKKRDVETTDNSSKYFLNDNVILKFTKII